MNDSAALPLGVFDSGLGGLTVARALLGALPDERILYLGDTARVPYGTRSAETVIRYARGCARVLTDRGIKALIVACNTVSAVALELLRAELDLPVIGVVQPGAAAAVRAIRELETAVRLPQPPKIGVLGTAGTINSGAYPRAVGQLSTRIEVIGRAAPLLVPLVEEGWLEGDVPELAVRRYVEPLIASGARVIVLGCTHYPLLKGVIAQVAATLCDEPVIVVDSADATAELVQALMAEQRIPTAQAARGPANRLELLVTDLPGSFAAVAGRFLGEATGGEPPDVRQIDLAADPAA
jgi:glutamate racemase